MRTATALWSRLADVAGLVATPLVPSHYVALLRPLAATHALQARVEAVHDETADARTLTLRPGRGWRPHRAGQNVRVGVVVNGRIATRTYSISSAESRDRSIMITVKAQPDGRVSRALVRDVKPGDYVSLGLPDGEFLLPDHPRSLLFITAGSGITPVMSMLRTLAATGPMPEVTHLHYAKAADDVIFGSELRELATTFPSYRLIEVYTRTDRRRISEATLDELAPQWRHHPTWACGPQSLLDATTACFAGAGRADALHVERFAAPVAPTTGTTGGGLVRFGKSRIEAITDGRTPLLQVAEAAGVTAPHGCRMGICHTCDAMLTSGCVRDLRTGERVDAGTKIQVCVCAAETDVEVAL
jgi:ferredoxin-NADP reductase